MNRDDFRALAETRLSEAKSVLDAGFPDGADYLSGYAVECALKACIARRTREFDFPPRVSEVRDMYTPDLAKLVRIAGLEADRLLHLGACEVFTANWTTVKDWPEESRYARNSSDSALSLYDSITVPDHGVLRWLRTHW